MAEQVTKTMLIVKSDANALKGVEQFLKNRDWNLVSTHDMKKAIVSLVQLKPSFVLISVDHPSKKMAKFPKIVMSAFPTCVMMFAEKSTTSSFKALMDSGVEYRINPPLTGPAIERAVNKYLRDMENAERQKGQQQNQNSDDKGQFDFSVEVKSGGEKQSGFVNVSATSQQSGNGSKDSNIGYMGNAGQEPDESAVNSIAQSLLAQLSGGDDADESSPATQSNNVTMSSQLNPVDARSQKSSGNVIQFPGPSTDTDDSLDVPLGTKKAKSNHDLPEDEGRAPGSLILNQGEKKQRPGPDSGEADPLKSGQDIMIGRARNNSGGYVPSGENVTSDSQLPGYDPQESSGAFNINPNEGPKKNQQRPRVPQGKTHIREGGIFSEDSIFVKGVSKTLDDTVVKGSGEVQSHLEDNTHLACIVVESPRFSGYLVAALGKDKKIDDQFVDMVRTRLMKFLIDAGEPIENESNMQVKVKRVDFEGWALEYAQFLRKSVHKGDEVAMAFFPFAEAQTKVGLSADETMVSVKTESIEAGQPLEFNLYIYLPTNKKYILYTPKGAVFQGSQKDRLVRQGVSDVHIQKDDIQGLSRYKAQNHLNSLIDKYDQKDGEKPTKKKAA